MPISEVILVSMLLLSIAMLAAGLFRHFSIPYTVLLVIIGLLLSEASQHSAHLEALQHFSLTPELVFFLFLPALIFESGLSLNARQLLQDLAPILTLAIPALLISTTLIGYGLWWLLDVDIIVALLFGALISATDPVAVVAIFKELGAPLRLNVLVEGESLFNDATAIVVFGILLNMALQGSSMGWLESGAAVLEFLRVFFGGALLGAAMGLLVSELLYRLNSETSAILVMSVVSAYLSFIIGEHLLHVSGVMATLAAAISLNSYGLTRIAREVKPLLLETWEFVGLVANSLLFLLVGLSINSSQLLSHLDTVLLVVVLVLVARAATVYTLVPLTTRWFSLPRIQWAERHIMWWGGLKGGLAIAIVLSIPESLAGRELLINLTLGVVLFTLMVNAWTIRPLMHRLGLDKLNDDELGEWKSGLQQAALDVSKALGHFNDQQLLTRQQLATLQQKTTRPFATDADTIPAPQRMRRLHLTALRLEHETLEQLYRTAIIDPYTYVDMRNRLWLDRETAHPFSHPEDNSSQQNRRGFFVSLEHRIVSLLRESNWAANGLARYQQLRLRQQLQRNLAGIILSQSVLEHFLGLSTADQSLAQDLIERYQHRLRRRQQRRTELFKDFAPGAQKLEQQMLARSALIHADRQLTHRFHHGELGRKAFNRIQQRIQSNLLSLRGHQRDLSLQEISTTLKKIPLFTGLSDAALQQLALPLQEVTFLQGDTVIGEGDKGDALYIIRQGEAEARHEKQQRSEVLGKLTASDFFGEMALLGESVRTASVIATSTLSLFRLSRVDLLHIASQHQEIFERLEQERQKRLPKRHE